MQQNHGHAIWNEGQDSFACPDDKTYSRCSKITDAQATPTTAAAAGAVEVVITTLATAAVPPLLGAPPKQPHFAQISNGDLSYTNLSTLGGMEG